jgi:Tfp pilus assembly protein PilW
VREQLNSKRNDNGFTVLEIMMASFLALIVLALALAWLLSAQKEVATNTNRAANNAAAQSVLDQLDSNLRFATAAYVSSDLSTLYVVNSPNICTKWYVTGGDLVEQTTSTAVSVVARGVPNVTFSGNTAYNGLVSVTFTLNQSSGTSDSTGVNVDQALSASNMSIGVGTGSCSFTS